MLVPDETATFRATVSVPEGSSSISVVFVGRNGLEITEATAVDDGSLLDIGFPLQSTDNSSHRALDMGTLVSAGDNAITAVDSIAVDVTVLLPASECLVEFEFCWGGIGVLE